MPSSGATIGPPSPAGVYLTVSDSLRNKRMYAAELSESGSSGYILSNRFAWLGRRHVIFVRQGSSQTAADCPLPRQLLQRTRFHSRVPTARLSRTAAHLSHLARRGMAARQIG